MGTQTTLEQLKEDMKSSLHHIFDGLEDMPLLASLNSPPVADNSIDNFSALSALEKSLQNCTACKLHLGRKNLVFAEGNPKAKICFVDGMVGDYEDAAAHPFQGPAGELFSKMLTAMKLQRENVYLLSVVKCRGPNSRPPTSDELNTCMPFWQQQLKILQPKVIICMGDLAAQMLLRTEAFVPNLRQKIHAYENSFCFVTYHPQTLLKDPEKKKSAWEDLQLVMKKEKEWNH